MSNQLSWEPRNSLLDRMPREVCERIEGSLQPVTLVLDQILYEAKAEQHAMVFPRRGVVSLQYALEDGHSSEVAMVGNEGMVGIALLVDSKSTPTRAIVEVPGEGFALSSVALTEEFRNGGDFQYAILRFTQALLSQMALTAVCNRHHTLEQRLCRWLLLLIDRMGGGEVEMTQKRISSLLGVRREGINEALKHLEKDGILGKGRGSIRVLDRAALLARSCECYQVMKQDYDRLLDITFEPH